ncbi:acyltransferase family protein [Paenibacillus thailandensis]|uniref:Acyltransferase family protein n=1 Tax=Paenibacillus thailandensis TaxID=393250 RepID=A0ABW5QVG6_9BACL
MTTINGAAKRPKLPELQLLRGMAILGVLSVHSTSFATADMTGSRLYFVYNFFNIFMKYGTPTFIFLSSFALFYNYYGRPLDRALVASFYRKRLLYILLPYLLFSIFYFALQQIVFYQAL